MNMDGYVKVEYTTKDGNKVNTNVIISYTGLNYSAKRLAKCMNNRRLLITNVFDALLKELGTVDFDIDYIGQWTHGVPFDCQHDTSGIERIIHGNIPVECVYLDGDRKGQFVKLSLDVAFSRGFLEQKLLFDESKIIEDVKNAIDTTKYHIVKIHKWTFGDADQDIGGPYDNPKK